MRKKIVLITGAAGEVGQALIKELSKSKSLRLVTLDLSTLPSDMGDVTHIQGDILDRALLDRLVAEYEIDTIYHLAALLSTRAEFSPERAHRVNVDGMLELLKLASEQSQWRGRPVQFIFPSSIAAYGMPDRESKDRYARVREVGVELSDDDVRVQQALLRNVGKLFLPELQTIGSRAAGDGGLSRCAFSGTH